MMREAKVKSNRMSWQRLINFCANKLLLFFFYCLAVFATLSSLLAGALWVCLFRPVGLHRSTTGVSPAPSQLFKPLLKTYTAQGDTLRGSDYSGGVSVTVWCACQENNDGAQHPYITSKGLNYERLLRRFR